MDNFKKLIQEKNSAIKEYGDFIKTLKNKECDKDVSGLIGLLKDRLAKFENLSCDNYSQTAADIDELNDRIYRQVNLLANLDKLSRDSDVYKKYNEVYNQKRIKLFVSEQICRVKKYYQILIALLGLIPFIIYISCFAFSFDRFLRRRRKKRNAFLRDLSDSYACGHSICRCRIFLPERGRFFKFLFPVDYSGDSHILPTLQL